MIKYRVRHALAAATVVAVIAACQTDEITGGAEQIGTIARDFGMDPANARGVPSGATSIDQYSFVLNSTLLPDQFSRSGVAPTAKAGYGSCTNIATTAKCLNWRTWGRDSVSDPRAPRLATYLNRRVTFRFIELVGPEHYGTTGANANIDAFELYASFENLRPSTSHMISLARYGLVVRGMLDQTEMLAYGVITEPDSLVLLNPNPQGDAGAYNWTSNATCPGKLPIAGANPFHLGPGVATNTAGRVTFDKCFGSSNIFYGDNVNVKPDSAPWARNDLATSGIAQQYNYILVYEGPVANNKVVARIQIGVDRDAATGQPIPNSFGPFPDARIPGGQLISGFKAAEGAPGSVTLNILPLEELKEGETYKIVLFNRATGVSAPAMATYYTITRDTTGKDDAGNPTVVTRTSPTLTVGEIFGGASNVQHVIRVTDALNPNNILKNFTDVGLQPPSATGGLPIWNRYLDNRGTLNTTQDDLFFDASTVSVGKLPMVPNATPVLFRISGSAKGTNRGDQLAIEFQHLSRPPIGFRYVVWAVSPDTNNAPIMLGGLTTPLPEERSLDNAATDPNGGVLAPTEILRALLLVRPTQFRALNIDYSKYTTVRLTVEAKDGVAKIAPIVVLEGPLVSPPAP